MLQTLGPHCPTCMFPMGRNPVVGRVVCFRCDLTDEQKLATYDYYHRQQMAGVELLATNPFDR